MKKTSLFKFAGLFLTITLLAACASSSDAVNNDKSEENNNDTETSSIVPNKDSDTKAGDKEDGMNEEEDVKLSETKATNDPNFNKEDNTDDEVIDIFHETISNMENAWDYDYLDEYSEVTGDPDFMSTDAYAFFYEKTKDSIESYVTDEDVAYTFFEEISVTRYDPKYRNFIDPRDKADIKTIKNEPNTFIIETKQSYNYYHDGHPEYESGWVDITHHLTFEFMDDVWKVSNIERKDI